MIISLYWLSWMIALRSDEDTFGCRFNHLLCETLLRSSVLNSANADSDAKDALGGWMFDGWWNFGMNSLDESGCSGRFMKKSDQRILLSKNGDVI